MVTNVLKFRSNSNLSRSCYSIDSPQLNPEAPGEKVMKFLCLPAVPPAFLGAGHSYVTITCESLIRD